MAEGTYEYECMRAELLGIEKPNYDEFIKNHPPQSVKNINEEDDIEKKQDLEHQDEQIKNISGGLDELNTILKTTQKKIHNFKAHCGSLTNLLRFKIGSSSSSPSSSSSSPSSSLIDAQPDTPTTMINETTLNNDNQPLDSNNEEKPIKSDLGRSLDNQTDKLDKMIDKAENAQYSMTYQIKEMKKFINK